MPRWEKSKLDLDQLRIEIRELRRTHMLYEVLRDELTKIGHWKKLTRGIPRKWKPEDCMERG